MGINTTKAKVSHKKTDYRVVTVVTKGVKSVVKSKRLEGERNKKGNW